MAPNAASIGPISGQEGGEVNTAGGNVINLTLDNHILEQLITVLTEMSGNIGKLTERASDNRARIDCLTTDIREIKQRQDSHAERLTALELGKPKPRRQNGRDAAW